MKAVILAAGKGTRMKEITTAIPKPMVIIKGKPMLEHIIEFIKASGVTDFGVVVGYKQTVVKDHFKDGSFLGVSITYIEQKEQTGTGAALDLTKEFVSGNHFLFSFGDVLTPKENYKKMLDYYHQSPCDVLLGMNEVDDPYLGAAIYTDSQNNIIRIIEKPPKGTSSTNLTNAGIMVLPSDVYDYTVKLKKSARGEYELTDTFTMFLKDGRIVKGYKLSGYWKDVGTAQDLETINILLS